MEKSALLHRTESEDAYLYHSDELCIRIRTKKDDVKELVLHYGDSTLFFDEEGYQYHTLMEKRVSDQYHDYWQACVTVPHRRVMYLFELTGTDGEHILLGDRGVVENTPEQYRFFMNGFKLPYLHECDRAIVPEWVKTTQWYQIFPERFANGDSTISPEDVLEWKSSTPPRNSDFFGGDLAGVLQKLDYLADLGVTGLYFCPIFKAPSNHKYDTIDYYEIDPHFGDKELFRQLVQEAHRRGIRVMLDAVFNHIGYESPQWQDVLEKGVASPYKDWFHIHNFPVIQEADWSDDIHHRLNYDTFAFQPKMPKLNTANPEVKQYLIDIATYWIKEFDIDAWRLDVADEVDHQFWKDFHKVVTSVKPDVYILGEVWHNAQPWLNGDEFHAVMNYPLSTSIKDYFLFKTISTAEFSHQLASQSMLYRQQINEVMFNLLDSHDTARILTLAKGNKDAVKAALAFMFLQIGTPCIYYGTEVGLEGEGDPDCRRVMIWDKEEQDKTMLVFTKELFSLRKKHQGYILDSERTLTMLENDLLQIILQNDDGKIVAYFNNGETVKKIDKKGESVLQHRVVEADNSIELLPDSFVIRLITR